MWIRSASRATLFENAKIAACASAVAPSTPRLIPTARSPARERLIDGSTSPCECLWPWPWPWPWGVVVTPTLTPLDAAVSAQTARLNFSCARLDLDRLSDFQSRWFSGAAG